MKKIFLLITLILSADLAQAATIVGTVTKDTPIKGEYYARLLKNDDPDFIHDIPFGKYGRLVDFSFTDVNPGNYELKIIQLKDNHIIDEGTKEITITDNNQLESVHFDI